MASGNESQRCSICGINEAVIFVKVVTNMQIQEKGLCAPCAVHYLQDKEKIKELNILDDRLTDVIDVMQQLLSGIVTNLSAIGAMIDSGQDVGIRQLVCRNCGYTYKRFKESGKLGCPNCYSAFAQHIEEFAFEVERGTTHRGWMPERFSQLNILKKEIRFLRNRMKLLLNNEEYEEAEKVRKKLERLMGNYDSNREYDLG